MDKGEAEAIQVIVTNSLEELANDQLGDMISACKDAGLTAERVALTTLRLYVRNLAKEFRLRRGR